MMTVDRMYAYLPASCRRQRSAIEDMFKELLSVGLSVVVIKSRVGLVERVQKHPARLFSRRGVCVYVFEGQDSTETLVRLLMTIRVWHKPVFHMVITDGRVDDELARTLAEDVRKPELERVTDRRVVGYVDPVDDELQVYSSGSSRFEEALDRIEVLEKARPIEGHSLDGLTPLS